MLRNDDSRKDEGRSSSGTRILETVQNDPVGPEWLPTLLLSSGSMVPAAAPLLRDSAVGHVHVLPLRRGLPHALKHGPDGIKTRFVMTSPGVVRCWREHSLDECHGAAVVLDGAPVLGAGAAQHVDVDDLDGDADLCLAERAAGWVHIHLTHCF